MERLFIEGEYIINKEDVADLLKTSSLTNSKQFPVRDRQEITFRAA